MPASKEQLALKILRLLEDVRWPDLHPGEDAIHGGLSMPAGSPRWPSTWRGDRKQVRNNEIYIGMYSPLADLIRDWQDAPSTPPTENK